MLFPREDYSLPLKIKDIVDDTDFIFCSLQEALISKHFFHLTGLYFESCETDLITTEESKEMSSIDNL